MKLTRTEAEACSGCLSDIIIVAATIGGSIVLILFWLWVLYQAARLIWFMVTGSELPRID